MAAHVVLLTIVVALFVLASRPGVSFSSDEGASLHQARLLERGTWLYDYPLASLDDADLARPFVRGNPGDHGLAPYAKHPVYPLLLRVFGAGTPGALTLSVFGTVAAAVTAAGLARRYGGSRSAAVLALWATGVATPLLFDAGLALAHTLAAAAVGAALLATERLLAGKAPRWPALLGIGAFSALAALLRTESLLVLLAFGAATVLVRRSRAALVGFGTIALGVVAAAVTDRLALHAIVGVSLPTPPSTGAGGIVGRWDGFYTTWLSATAAVRSAGATLLWIALLVLAVAAWLRRTRRIAPSAYAAATVIAVVLYAVRALVDPADTVPGLLVTVPALWGLAWFADPSESTVEWRAAAVGAALACVAVLATQYSIGGGVEWGGRYFAVVLPALVAVVVVAALPGASVAVPPGTVRRVVVAAALLITLIVAGLALATLRSAHGTAIALSEAIAEAAGNGSGRVVVVTSNRLLPQILYDDIDRYDWVAASSRDLPGLARELARSGVDRLVLVAPGAEALVGQWDEWTIRTGDQSNAYDVLVVETRR